MGSQLTARATLSVRRISFVWLDQWTGRHGLDIEVRVGLRVYAVEVGFGHCVRFHRGIA